MATSKALLERIVKTYADASLDLLQRIAAKEARGSRASFEKALLRDIAETVSTLDKFAGDWLREAIPQFYLEGMQSQLDHLNKLGIEVPLYAEMTKVHQAAVNVLVENAYDDLTTAHREVGRKVKDNLRRIGLDAVTTKVSTGQTVRETAKGLLERLQAEGLKSAGGMRLDAYANLVAVSSTREATNRGAINQSTELGYDLVRMSTHSSPCPICAKLEGRVYSVSGDDKRFPALYGTAFKGGYASPHPHCKHNFSTWVEKLVDDPEKEREFSNRPFADDRTEKQRTAYGEAQAKKRKARARKLERERKRLEAVNAMK